MEEVNLVKGGRVDLQKHTPSLKKIRIELGWKENRFSTGTEYDLDVTMFLLNHDSQGNATCSGPKNMIFYNNEKSANGAIIYHGDNLKGGTEKITADVVEALTGFDEASIVVTIHEAIERKQNFGQIENAYIKIFNDEDGKLISSYSLDENFSSETAVQFGSLYRNPAGNLAFRAVGQGFNAGLADFCQGYGLKVAKPA